MKLVLCTKEAWKHGESCMDLVALNYNFFYADAVHNFLAAFS